MTSWQVYCRKMTHWQVYCWKRKHLDNTYKIRAQDTQRLIALQMHHVINDTCHASIKHFHKYTCLCRSSTSLCNALDIATLRFTSSCGFQCASNTPCWKMTHASGQVYCRTTAQTSIPSMHIYKFMHTHCTGTMHRYLVPNPHSHQVCFQTPCRKMTHLDRCIAERWHILTIH